MDMEPSTHKKTAKRKLNCQMINKEKYVSFAEMSLKIAYEKLKDGKE